MQSNIKNRTIFHADNLNVLEGMDSESVDLIYLDPPFNKNETFIGSHKQLRVIKEYFTFHQKQSRLFPNEDFNEIFKESPKFDDIWRHTDTHQKYYSQIDEYNNEIIAYLNSVRNYTAPGTFYYLIYMTIRLIEMRRILKDTGSIYLHCDTTMSHYIKSILDKIFGYKNFRNEIVWHYRTYQGKVETYFPKKHDTIFAYLKSNAGSLIKQLEYKNNYKETVDYERWKKYYVEGNKIYYGNHPKTDSRFTAYLKKWIKGKKREPNIGELIYECKGYVVDDVWVDKPAIDPKDTVEKVGYPTQKPISLLGRIIESSTNEDDVVLDPFCGCATTCVAAERLGRKWIGIDKNIQAYYMVYYRLATDKDIKMGTIYRTNMLGRNLTLETKIPKKTNTPSEEFARKVKDHELVAYDIGDSGMTQKQKIESKEILYEKQSGMCNGCDSYLRKVDLTIDHIIPQKEKKDHSMNNLQLLCYRCNNWKRTGSMRDLIQKLRDSNIIPEGVYKKQIKIYS